MRLHYKDIPDPVKQKVLDEFPGLEFRWYYSPYDRQVKGYICGEISKNEQAILILKYSEYLR
jgi:hypothetical protein